MNLEEPPTEPDSQDLLPLAPLDEEAQKLWDAVSKYPWITSEHRLILTMLCQSWSDWQRARGLARLSILPTGEFRTADGKLVKTFTKNPALTAANEAFQRVRSAASELGLSPSARSGIGAGGGKRDPIAEKYFA